MKYAHAVLLSQLYMQAYPLAVPVDIVRDVFRVQPGENAKCKHAYLTLRKMEADELITLNWRR